MIPTELEELHRTFWNSFHNKFNLSTNEGCGQYTEAWVKYAQNHGYNLVGHLKKNPGQTQYNGHANDAFLYANGDGNDGGKYQAVDLIGGAEGPNPTLNWGVDIPRYTIADWLKEPGSSSPVPVPQPTFPGYEELGGDNLCRVMIGMPLMADYTEANQAMNDGSVVWTNRSIYDALRFIFVDKQKPEEAYRNSAAKHRPEWRKELGLK